MLSILPLIAKIVDWPKIVKKVKFEILKYDSQKANKTVPTEQQGHFGWIKIMKYDSSRSVIVFFFLLYLSEHSESTGHEIHSFVTSILEVGQSCGVIAGCLCKFALDWYLFDPFRNKDYIYGLLWWSDRLIWLLVHLCSSDWLFMYLCEICGFLKS